MDGKWFEMGGERSIDTVPSEERVSTRRETVSFSALLSYAQSHPLANTIAPERLAYYVEAGIALGESVAKNTLERFKIRTFSEYSQPPVSTVENMINNAARTFSLRPRHK